MLRIGSFPRFSGDLWFKCPLLDNLIQELIPKLRGQFAFYCVPPQRRAGAESIWELGNRTVGKKGFKDIDHSSQTFVWNSLLGDSLEFLSGPLHRGCLARILSGFGVLFIFWPRYVFPAPFIACANYAGGCWQEMFVIRPPYNWDCHLVLRVTGLVSRPERVSVENEQHRLPVSGKS